MCFTARFLIHVGQNVGIRSRAGSTNFSDMRSVLGSEPFSACFQCNPQKRELLSVCVSKSASSSWTKNLYLRLPLRGFMCVCRKIKGRSSEFRNSICVSLTL